MYAYNPFGTDTAEAQEKISPSRIGRRIRTIRESTDPRMSQNDLGEAIGLNGSRIQQYESGTRTPRLDVLQQIAAALDVETAALTDPDTGNYIGVMYALFEMETLFGLKLKEIEGKIYLSFENTQITSSLQAWYKRYQELKLATVAASDEDREKAIREYHRWEWTFPRGLTIQSDSDKQRERLERYMAQIQAQLAELDNED